MPRAFALVATMAALAVMLTAPAAEAAGTTPSTWISRINTYRVGNGRIRLAEDHQASQVAQQWTNAMAATRRLAHNPAYKIQVTTPWYRIGENVGYGGSETAVFSALTSSPGHRANMLRPEYNRLGVGHAVVNGRVWTTHIFIATTRPTTAPAA